MKIVLFILLSSFFQSSFDETKPIVSECVYTTGIITAKRSYCTIDCRYTLIVYYNKNKFATEVTVPYDVYMFKHTGSEFEILICK